MPASLPNPGDLIGGKYRIVRLLGEGGMGSVYEARHEHLGSVVALKFLHPELAERPHLVARFLQEARVSASIRSTHVTQVIDVDQTPEGAAYLVMELLEGETLEKRLERGSPLPIFDAVDIGVQILSALEAAHARNIVHRDLKPDNVWLAPGPMGPHVKLLDFGIAKLKASDEFRQVTTRPGSMMGTPAYMAPEQAISADQVDHRADLYSFGVMLYEMLSGSRPVDSEDPREILEHLMRGDVRPLGSKNSAVPPGLAALVDRLVTPNPEARPASAAVVRAELSRYARPSSPFVDGGPDRPSRAVPETLPPEDRSAPPFTSRAGVADLARASTEVARSNKTQAMSASADLAPRAGAPAATVGFAGPAMGAYVPVPAPRRPKSHTGLVVTAIVVVVGLASAGIWALMNPSIFDDEPAPPMPGPMPTAITTPAATATQGPAPIDTTNAPPVVEPVPNRRESPPEVRPPSGTEPRGKTHPEAPPAPTFPPFPLPQVPSGFVPSFPPGLIPSAFAPFIPQIPGLTVPNVPPPSAPSSAAPPANSASLR